MQHWTKRGIALVAAVALTTLGVGSATAEAQKTVTIQPGISIESGGGYCTLNWIYDGEGAQAGSVYGGTAAHCVSAVGEQVSIATGSLGDPIAELGTVAYIDDNLDYAFIEIAPAQHDAVDPAMKGHPAIPTGVSTTETAATGDTMQFSGNGVGFHLLPQTQEGRTGILHSNDGTQHHIIGAVSPGDSGGPVANVTDDNKAFGIVNTVGVGVNGLPYAGEGGVSLEGMLADAADAGFTVTLRTV